MDSESGDDGSIDELARLWSQSLGSRVTLITADGTVAGESSEDRTQMDNHLKRPEIQRAISEGFGSSVRRSTTVGYEMMYVAVPVHRNGEMLGFARVALSIEQIDTDIAQLQKTIRIALLLGAVLTIALSTIIAGRTASPLESLTRVAIEMAHTENEPPSPTAPYDEVGKLAEAFNALVSQLRTQIRALETEQDKLASVLEQMTDGVIISDTDGFVEMINPKAADLFEAEKGVGQTIIQALRNHQIVESWRKCHKTGKEQVLSLEIPRNQKFIQVVILPLKTGLSGKYLLLFQDLTRTRRLETVRRDFISNISHELRTPLASIKALTETLQAGAIGEPQAAKRFLSRMELEVDALTQMVAELLELTRIESGQVPIELKPVPPKELLKNASERLGLQAERANLSISIYCPEDLPNVLADPPRIGQALVNLLHNAIKFTPEGGEITMAAWQQGDVIVFSIEDTGVGIPVEDLPRIFERFYKADRSRSGGGTGLGLAITRHLVQAHGGRIWADSIQGEGSTFSFSLPIEK
jgi:two-component system phosphate regulon sensor histidine kinase PhoR